MSPKLEWSEALGRMTRTEPVEEQGILTWDLVRTAILEGKADEAIDWIRYIQQGEGGVKSRSAGHGVQAQLGYIAERWGEEHVEGALRYWRRKLIDAGNEPTYSMTPLERLHFHVETERGDTVGVKDVSVHEEPDRYVLTADRCAGCAVLRRVPATAPFTHGETKQAYRWSWGRAGVPYFTAHQCLWWELMAIEDIGYPVRVHDWSDDASAPCRIFFYKSPELIPAEYFERVGMTRDPSRFR